jgi:hypothetical protein
LLTQKHDDDVMADTKGTIPSLIPSFLMALAVLLGVIYFLFTDLKPSSRTEHTLEPIEVVESEPEITVIDPEPELIKQQQIKLQEAQSFVEALATTQNKEIAVTILEDHDEFVRHDGKILLPKLEQRNTTVEELLSDESIAGDAPLTLQYLEEKQTETNLNTLASQREDHTAPITIMTESGEVITAPLADLLAHNKVAPEQAVTLVETITHTAQTTSAALAELNIDQTQQIVATINRGTQELSVKEIIQSGDIPDNALFYLHRVTDEDTQGLWGIVQAGLIDKFRQGIQLDGIMRNKDLIQVTIPADADEPLPSGLSSFLGKLLNNKVESSYVYNFSTDSMGRNPNVIHPGQQLILIHFTNNELSNVYQFFSDKRNANVETFAITP